LIQSNRILKIEYLLIALTLHPSPVKQEMDTIPVEELLRIWKKPKQNTVFAYASYAIQGIFHSLLPAG